MKTRLLLTVISAFFVLAGCSSTGTQVAPNNSNGPEGSISDNNDSYTSLADYLRQVPGVNVMGSGDNASVTIRGTSSFSMSNSPLFVIDGSAVGNSYSQANNTVNPRDIDYVRVLKGPDTSIYGVRGANGVIEIVTKKT